MKKMFTAFMVFVMLLALVGCPNDSKNDADQKTETTLKISNDGNRDIREATWNGTTFGRIEIGYNKTVNVNFGTGYIYFSIYREAKPSYPYYYRTVRTREVITVAEGDTETYIIQNSTIIVDIRTNNTYTLEGWASNPPPLNDGNWDRSW